MVPYPPSTVTGCMVFSATRHLARDTGPAGTAPPQSNCASVVFSTTKMPTAATGRRTLTDVKNIVRHWQLHIINWTQFNQFNEIPSYIHYPFKLSVMKIPMAMWASANLAIGIGNVKEDIHACNVAQPCLYLTDIRCDASYRQRRIAIFPPRKLLSTVNWAMGASRANRYHRVWPFFPGDSTKLIQYIFFHYFSIPF